MIKSIELKIDYKSCTGLVTIDVGELEVLEFEVLPKQEKDVKMIRKPCWVDFEGLNTNTEYIIKSIHNFCDHLEAVMFKATLHIKKKLDTILTNEDKCIWYYSVRASFENA